MFPSKGAKNNETAASIEIPIAKSQYVASFLNSLRNHRHPALKALVLSGYNPLRPPCPIHETGCVYREGFCFANDDAYHAPHRDPAKILGNISPPLAFTQRETDVDEQLCDYLHSPEAFRNPNPQRRGRTRIKAMRELLERHKRLIENAVLLAIAAAFLIPLHARAEIPQVEAGKHIEATGAVLTIRANATGACPAKVKMAGLITTSAPGKVNYSIVDGNGEISGPFETRASPSAKGGMASFDRSLDILQPTDTQYRILVSDGDGDISSRWVALKASCTITIDG